MQQRIRRRRRLQIDARPDSALEMMDSLNTKHRPSNVAGAQTSLPLYEAFASFNISRPGRSTPRPDPPHKAQNMTGSILDGTLE